MQTPEQGSSIDILQWVDQLEALLTEGWRIPFTANVVVDEHAVFEIIDQMRIRIPEELKQARRIQQQQERLLAQAKEEANRIKAQARQEAEAALSQHEADQYALQVLRELEAALEASLRQVRNGIKKISSRQFEAGGSLDSDADA